MSKRTKVLIIAASIFLCAVIIITTVTCYFCIPRIVYEYDKHTDSYVVEYAFGNGEEYRIQATMNDKPVTAIKERAFYQKTKLKKIVFENPESLTSIGRLAFYGCSNLSEIDLSKVDFIDRNAFEDCTSLTSIQLSLKNIYGSTFYGCTKLKEVKFEGVSTIGAYAFAHTALEEITISTGISSVYNDAFYGCESLAKIFIKSNTLSKESIAYLESLKVELHP